MSAVTNWRRFPVGSGFSWCRAHLHRVSGDRSTNKALCAAESARCPRRTLGSWYERRGVVPSEKWVTLVIAEERGGVIGAGSCGYICMRYSDEMLSAIAIASVFSQRVGGRVGVGRHNSLSLDVFLKDLKLFFVYSAGLAIGKAGGCGFPLKPPAEFRKLVCLARPLDGPWWSGLFRRKNRERKGLHLTPGGNFSHTWVSPALGTLRFPGQAQRASFPILNLFMFPARTENPTVVKMNPLSIRRALPSYNL